MAAPLARSSPEGSIVSMGADLIEVTGVKVLGHYRLRLTFSDGRVGDVDVSDVRDKGNMFADLRDPDYFAQVRVDPDVGTIAWPNGLDFAPERLYREAGPPGPIVVFDSDALAHRLRELAVGMLRLLRALADSIGHTLESRSRTRI
jgi:hypothetical protein